jgi:hypothetical protein
VGGVGCGVRGKEREKKKEKDCICGYVCVYVFEYRGYYVKNEGLRGM